MVGTFEIENTDNDDSDGEDSDPGVQLMSCNGTAGNSATHTNNLDKRIITLRWRAPRDFEGIVFFR